MLAAVLRCVMFIWIYRIAALRTTRARFAMGHLIPPRVAGEERKFVPAARFFASEFLLNNNASQNSSPPGSTRWSMQKCGSEKPIAKSDRASLAWIAGSSPAMTKRKDHERRKRNADRRVCPTSAPYGRGARPAGRARLSAFHHGSCRQGFRPLGATPGQASWDVAGRSIRYGRPNRGAKISRSYAGVTRARLSQSRERTSRTGRSAGQMMPEAARERSVSFHSRAPHSLRFREYPRPKASFTERDSLNAIPEMGTIVNKKSQYR